MKKSTLLLPCLAVLLSLIVAPANAQWKVVKKFIQPEVTIVEETKAALILSHPEIDALVVMTMKPGKDVAMTMGSEDAPDIYGQMNQKRGGNPYRVWVASENFWNDPDRPKQVWGRFFRTEFLKILRPPTESLDPATAPAD